MEMYIYLVNITLDVCFVQLWPHNYYCDQVWTKYNFSAAPRRITSMMEIFLEYKEFELKCLFHMYRLEELTSFWV